MSHLINKIHTFIRNIYRGRIHRNRPCYIYLSPLSIDFIPPLEESPVKRKNMFTSHWNISFFIIYAPCVYVVNIMCETFCCKLFFFLHYFNNSVLVDRHIWCCYVKYVPTMEKPRLFVVVQFKLNVLKIYHPLLLLQPCARIFMFNFFSCVECSTQRKKKWAKKIVIQRKKTNNSDFTIGHSFKKKIYK